MGVHVYVEVRGQLWETFLRHHPPCCGSRGFSLGSGPPLRVVLASTPGGPPCLPSALRLQVHATSFLLGYWGIELRSSWAD